MHAAIVARRELTSELARGIGRSELTVLHQPIMNLETLHPVGVEALVRWRHPTRGLVEPDAFIALAEESGSILPLGRYVLETRPPRSSIGTDRHLPERQRLGRSDPAGRLPGRGRAGPRALRPAGRTAGAGDHRVGHVPRHAGHHRQAHRAAPLGCPDRDRRLRHGLLVADLPAPLPGRHPQDRQGLHRAGHRRDARMGVRGRHPGAGPPARPAGRGGGRRGPGAAGTTAWHGLRAGPGLLLRAPGAAGQLIPRTNRFLASDQAASAFRRLSNADIAAD